MLKKLFGVEDFSKIPVQASMDATATTGRLHTRRSEGSEDRVVYGLSTPAGPYQKTSLIFNHEEPSCVKVNPSGIIFNGMDTVLESFEDKAIARATSYNCIILLPLIPNARPYCIGMFSVCKGRDTDDLIHAHHRVCRIAKDCGIKIVTLPGDGDVTLRTLQWRDYSCDRGFNWLKNLSIPLQQQWDRPPFPAPELQDPLHDLKKGEHVPTS